MYQQNNNSNVVFGDDRISVRKSMAQEVRCANLTNPLLAEPVHSRLLLLLPTLTAGGRIFQHRGWAHIVSEGEPLATPKDEQGRACEPLQKCFPDRWGRPN